MSLSGSEISIPPNFAGMVRLFPLPNLVLFPGVVQALHIFEPRYRELTSDSLLDDKLISMSLYRANELALTETENLVKPRIHSTICVCKIMASKELPDGRYNLLVAGVKRARIIREIDNGKPYREAQVELLEDHTQPDSEQLGTLREELFSICDGSNLMSKLTEHLDLKTIVGSKLPLGLLVDLICFLSNLDCEKRLLILELVNVEARCRTLIQMLRDGASTNGNCESPNSIDDEFPPNFSLN